MATPEKRDGAATASLPMIGPDLDQQNLADMIINEPPPALDTTNPSTNSTTTLTNLPKVVSPSLDIDETSAPAMVTPLNQLQKSSAWIDCPHCDKMAKTSVVTDIKKEEVSGLVTCLVCLVCWPMLFCLPTSETRSWVHRCSKCNAIVAIRAENGGIDIKAPVGKNLVPSKLGARKEQLN